MQQHCEESETLLDELEHLRSRIHIWEHYPSEWGAARRMQLQQECVRPVRLRALQDFVAWGTDATCAGSSSSTSARCVHTHNLAKPPGYSSAGPLLKMRHVSVVLNHFSPPSLSAPVSVSCRMFARRLREDWDGAVADVAGVPAKEAWPRRLLCREQNDSQRMCMTRRAETVDGTLVPWNLCEGPVWDPEDLDPVPAATSTPMRVDMSLPRTGVVLVQRCAQAKVDRWRASFWPRSAAPTVHTRRQETAAP